MDGLKTKKAAKVHENHAWNCRLLRGQLELLKSSIIEAIRRVFIWQSLDQSDDRQCYPMRERGSVENLHKATYTSIRMCYTIRFNPSKFLFETSSILDGLTVTLS